MLINNSLTKLIPTSPRFVKCDSLYYYWLQWNDVFWYDFKQIQVVWWSTKLTLSTDVLNCACNIFERCGSLNNHAQYWTILLSATLKLHLMKVWLLCKQSHTKFQSIYFQWIGYGVCIYYAIIKHCIVNGFFELCLRESS